MGLRPVCSGHLLAPVFQDDTYTESYISTIGVDFKIRTIELDGNHQASDRECGCSQSPGAEASAFTGEGLWAWSPGLTCPSPTVL